MSDRFVLGAEFDPVIARYLRQRAPVESNRTQGADLPGLWPGLVEEIGVAGLLVPEHLGGQGAGLMELGSALREAGRQGWSGPLAATAGVAVHLLAAVDPDDDGGLRSAIAQGRVVVPALTEDGRGESLETTVRYEDGTVRGRRTFVDSGTHAAEFLLPARAGDETALVVVERTAAGVAVRPQDAVDPGRGLAMLELAGAPARVLARGPQVGSAVAEAWSLGALLVAADAVGAAERAFELARAYAGTREQFGRPIGSFQVVKHKLVEMYAELELSRSALREALRMADARLPGWQSAAAAAKSVVGDGSTHVLREAIQVHGGIGFTWEHELTHHFRRVMACRALYGTPASHRRNVAAARGLA
ncbi:acyl-CoA dehydrogenase family protein [Dactylosporangium sp. CA-139066]|uniref:acyl-CoA dehydrogenase family protein n=1 Tax=Dactylosporangium sp. CA-139066 TaxID=3239930 RepID=UPI003D932B94